MSSLSDWLVPEEEIPEEIWNYVDAWFDESN